MSVIKFSDIKKFIIAFCDEFSKKTSGSLVWKQSIKEKKRTPIRILAFVDELIKTDPDCIFFYLCNILKLNLVDFVTHDPLKKDKLKTKRKVVQNTSQIEENGDDNIKTKKKVKKNEDESEDEDEDEDNKDKTTVGLLEDISNILNDAEIQIKHFKEMMNLSSFQNPLSDSKSKKRKLGSRAVIEELKNGINMLTRAAIDYNELSLLLQESKKQKKI